MTGHTYPFWRAHRDRKDCVAVSGWCARRRLGRAAARSTRQSHRGIRGSDDRRDGRRESCYPVRATMDRLEAFLRAKGVDVAARIDHAAAAAQKGLALRPTEVLV